jgi:hypothetical protein
MLLSGLKNKPVELPIDSAEYAELLSGLVAESRYQKKTVSAKAGNEDMAKSF